MSIRSTAKALILHEDKILLNKCYDENNGYYYSMPGGGQNKYETLFEAITRECLEETGYSIRPIRFAGICEEICLNEEFRKNFPLYAHKMYHIFICELEKEEAQLPTEVDSKQICSEWIKINSVKEIRLLPTVVGENIIEVINGTSPVFLGSEHIKFNHG